MKIRIPRAYRLRRFLQGYGPEVGPISLDRHRIFILPTRHGIVFAGMLFVLLLGSINYNNSLGFGLTFLLGSLGVVSILHTFRNLEALRFDVQIDHGVFVGQDAAFHILTSTLRDRSRFSIQLESQDSATNLNALSNSAQTTSQTLTFVANKRGRLNLPRLTISTRYPLGLFRAWAYLNFDAACLAYPKPVIDERPFPTNTDSDMNKGKFNPGMDDFVGLRIYQPGDSIRHIHWKAVAKSEILQTKLFAVYPSGEIILDWNQLGGYATEMRLSILCRWVLEAERKQIRYALHLPNVVIAANRGEKHRLRCLEALALYGN